MRITSLAGIVQVAERLAYSSPDIELDFYPTFEVDAESWDNIQKEVGRLSAMMVPKIPYEQKEAYLSFMYCGIKCVVRPIPQPYKNSEVVNTID
jgi:hypothetical protein